MGLRFTVTAKNIHEVGQYVDFAAALGVRRITFYRLSAAGRAQKLPQTGGTRRSSTASSWKPSSPRPGSTPAGWR